MRFLIFTIILSLAFSGLKAQALFVKKQFCKKQDVEIITGSEIPEGFVVVAIGSVERVTGVDAVDKLPAKDIRKMKRHGKMFRSCSVLADFSGKVMTLQDKHGNPLDDYIHFYALQPAYRIAGCEVLHGD